MRKEISSSNAERVQHHRERAVLANMKRIEVKIDKQDELLIKTLAKHLRENEKEAEIIRSELAYLIPDKNDINIVDFFRNSPLAQAATELDIARSKDTGSSLSF